jgi:hypothetical protein
MPPVTPLRPSALISSLTNGTSADDAGHVSQQNGSTVLSRTDEDAHMTDSQDLNNATENDLQTPSRLGTQTQKSQASARTFIAPNANPQDYQNDASTTTSGLKTSDQSSGPKLTQSTNGATPAGLLNFSDMIPLASGSQLPDTQGLSSSYLQILRPQRFSANFPSTSEVHYVSSQPSNSQPSQSSMPAPAPPRHTNLGSILNDDTTSPQLIVDDKQINEFHDLIVSRTSGCSLEQLEQITAALMDAIWKQRDNWNRNVVLHRVMDAFNEIIADIDAMQAILALSHGEEEEEAESLPQPLIQAPRITQRPMYTFPESQVGTQVPPYTTQDGRPLYTTQEGRPFPPSRHP